jgi:2-phospho-L-lactate/phosphoenolpyruvate guanylyltransferase
MTTWTAIVPIKPWAIAKARLDLLPQHRKELARAFSLDIIDAVTSADRVGAVVIVSAERGVQALARTLNAAIVEDRPLLEADPLNRAVMLGAHWGRAMRPQSPVVVVPADLPAMSAAALDDALVQLEEHRSAFVPDRRGTGTTLLAARRPHQMRVAFGAASPSVPPRRPSTGGSGTCPSPRPTRLCGVTSMCWPTWRLLARTDWAVTRCTPARRWWRRPGTRGARRHTARRRGCHDRSGTDARHRPRPPRQQVRATVPHSALTSCGRAGGYGAVVGQGLDGDVVLDHLR